MQPHPQFHLTSASSHIRHAPAMPSKAQLTTHTHTGSMRAVASKLHVCQMSMFTLGQNKCVPKNNDTHIKDVHTSIPTDQTCTDFNHAHPLWLCYCFENMIEVTDGMGRGEGSGRGEWQGPTIVSDQCESVSIAIETGATLGRHAFISTTGSLMAIRGQINPPGCSGGVCKGLQAHALVYLNYHAFTLL